MIDILCWFVSLALTIVTVIADPQPQAEVETEISSQASITYTLDDAPTCWEDEVYVVVVSDPYGDLEGTVGCVPADNLPVTGNRP